MVESHKDQLFAEVIKVAEKIGAPAEMIESLTTAKEEIQFSKAVESIKKGVPEVLLIKGQNPLILLHNALSVGLHQASDEKCLQLAQSIRLVLAELAERISLALKEEAELNNAVSRLLNVDKLVETEIDEPTPQSDVDMT